MRITEAMVDRAMGVLEEEAPQLSSGPLST